MQNAYRTVGNNVYIRLNKNKYGAPTETVIDKDQLEIVSAFPGHFYVMQHQKTKKFYARGYYWNRETKKILQPLLHRLITKPEPGFNTKHRDDDTLNNTKNNLVNVRIADAFNVQERKPTDPAKGVSWHKKKQKWEAKITHNKQRYNLGYWEKGQVKAANTAVEEFRKLGPTEYFNKYGKR